MNKRKRFIALLLCVLLTICALPLTALAAYAPVGTEDEPSSVRLYEYYTAKVIGFRSLPRTTGTHRRAKSLIVLSTRTVRRAAIPIPASIPPMPTHMPYIRVSTPY